jgi:DNA-directed RNA polymerase subunit RPC12/RpoP
MEITKRNAGGSVEITCKTCGLKLFIRKSRKTENNYCSLECYYKALTGSKNYKTRGKRHWHWKGDEATYSSIHDWIRKKKGKAGNYKCVHCGKQARDWANIDHVYSRDLDDYIPLCRKCHIKFDKNL